MPDPRIPGAPPPGAPPPRIGMASLAGQEVDGPVGKRVVTPEKAAAMHQLAQAAREAATAPPNSPALPEVPQKEEKEANPLQDELEKDDFYDSLKDRMVGGLAGIHDLELAMAMAFLDSKERRKKIESRLQPIDPNSRVLKGEFRQVVPLWGPDAPEVEFRSLNGRDQFAISYMMTGGEMAQLGNVANNFLLVAAGVVRIGEDRLPEFPQKGTDEDRRRVLKERLDRILVYPYEMIWDMYVNHLWFQARIRLALYGKDSPFRSMAAK